MPVPRSGEMGARPGKRLWNQTARLVPTITVAICFGELIIVLALAIALLAASTFKFSIAVLPFLLRPRGMDVGRLYHASPCVTCYRPSPARDSPPARRYRQDLLANMARLRRCLLDNGRHRSGRRASLTTGICLSAIAPIIIGQSSELPC
jgi:hypothetical protein